MMANERKVFQGLKNRVRQGIGGLPLIVGNEAVNWTKERFYQKNWLGTGVEAWPPRKPGAPRNRGRSLLIDTSRLFRSIRIISVSQSGVKYGTDVHYARAHNYGFRGLVHVRQHTRRKFGIIRKGTHIFKDGKQQFRNTKAPIGGSIVRAHGRRMNLPRRQFLGKSPFLVQRLIRMARLHMIRTIKQ